MTTCGHPRVKATPELTEKVLPNKCELCSAPVETRYLDFVDYACGHELQLDQHSFYLEDNITLCYADYMIIRVVEPCWESVWKLYSKTARKWSLEYQEWI